MWILMAVFSAFFAGVTGIIAKYGLNKTDSDVATAMRTVVVFLFAWAIVWISGTYKSIGDISTKSFLFLILSGVATGAAWFTYFRALSIGDVNKVAPVDRSSTILSVIIAVFLFQETKLLQLKIVGTLVLAVGIILMVDFKNMKKTNDNKWLSYAILSSVFTALTAVLAKIGVEGVPSNLATAIRTTVVLGISWIFVFLKGKGNLVKKVGFAQGKWLLVSGFTIGLSWLCYYYAIQQGVLSIVVPIDKMSLVVAVLGSTIFFKEKLSTKSAIGLSLMVIGTIIITITN